MRPVGSFVPSFPFACLLVLITVAASAQNIAVTTRHAPVINGSARVEGSIQQLLGDDVMVNGGATFTEDLLVPGTPEVIPNGSVTWQGVEAGSGSLSPSGYAVRLNGGATLRFVRTRVDPPALPHVSAPPAPMGSRSVTLKTASDTVGSWATLRDLTLNDGGGARVVPPGTYGLFTANGQTAFTLGVAGATQPSVYNFQALALNGQASLNIVGPVIITTGSGLKVNGDIGVSAHPDWLQLRLANGGVTLNPYATFHGSIVAPSGAVIVTGQSALCGTAACDRFTLHGGGLVRWCNTLAGAGNRPPTAQPQNVTTAEDQSVAIALSGSDPDENALAFTVTNAPAHGTLSGIAPNLTYMPDANFNGTETFTFFVHDGQFASEPAVVTIIVTPVNDPPVVSAGADLAVTAPTGATLQGIVRDDGDPDGAPLALQWTKVSGPGEVTFGHPAGAQTEAFYSAAGVYLLRLTANDGEFEVSDDLQLTVTRPNQPPVVNAGPDAAIAAGASAALAGTASDDGVPTGASLTPAWSRLSGPGAVTFANSASLATAATFSAPGEYVLRLLVSDSQFTGSDLVNITVAAPNQPPVVSAGPDQAIEHDAPASLAGSATDDGLPRGFGFSFTWNKISGPGSVAFADGFAAATSATFSAPGTYVLQLSASDGELTGSNTVSVAVRPPPNRAPAVNAGPDQTLETGRSAQLNGSATDDGRPVGAALTFAWDRISGPGALTFSNPASAATSAFFETAGTHVLKLTVSDGELSASDEISITVALTNQAPVVDAGFDQAIAHGQPVTLSGTVADDGLPAGQAITLAWTKLSGPGAVTFASPTSARTTAAFSQAGSYVLRLTASDTALTGSGDVTVIVACVPAEAPAGLVGFWKGEDQAYDARGATDGVALNGATYTTGKVGRAFSLDGVNDEIQVVSTANPSTVDVGRAGGFTVECWVNPTSASGARPICEWDAGGGAGVHIFGSLNSGNIFVNVVDTAGGNHTASTPNGVMTAGVWQHFAFTFDKASSRLRMFRNAVEIGIPGGLVLGSGFTPRTTGALHIGARPGSAWFTGAMDEFSLYDRALAPAEIQAIFAAGGCGKTDGFPEEYPTLVVNAGPDAAIGFPQSAALAATVIDRRPDRSTPLALQWSKVSGPGAVRFAPDRLGTSSAYFTEPGTYVLRLTASDGSLLAADELVIEAGAGPFTRTIALQSGNGTQTDPLNRFTTNGGVTWQPATLTANGAYALLPGTSYITGPFASFSSTTLRARCVLPPSLSNPRLSSQFFADNAIRVRLNQTQIAQAPAGFTTDQLRNYTGTAVFTAPPSSVTVTDPALFVSGENILELENFNSSGPMGVNYTAAISFEATGAAGNQPPLVEAGPDRTLGAPASTSLPGTVSDDALPLPDLTPAHVKWEKLAGPGTIAFSAPSSPNTTATFSAPGEYLLQLTASDGEYAVTDTLAVTVLPPVSGQNAAPVVSAGPDRGVGMLASVSLEGLAADDSQPLAALQIAWQMVSGPGTVAFADPHAAITSAVFSAAGDYVLSLSASDGALTATDTVSVTVSHSTYVNLTPKVAAGADRTEQLPAAEVTLAGSVTDDGLPEQWPVAMRWEILSAPGAAELRDADDLVATARFAAAGDYVFRFTASDGLLSASDEVVVHVLPAPSSDSLNAAPVVFAGTDGSVAGLGPAALTGTVTDDGRPGPIISVAWSKVSGPGAVQFSNAAAAQTDVTFNAPGAYVLRLTASDGLLSASDEVQVVAGAGGNQPPTISAGPDGTAAAGVPIILTPEWSDDGLPTGVLELSWSVVSGPGAVSLGGGADGGVTAEFGTVGVYTLRARASDGELEAFDDVVITVTRGTNAPPLVQFTAPAAGASVPSGQPFSLVATASDPEGALLGVEFFADDEFIASDTEPGFLAVWTPFAPGAHTLTAVAIDAIGQETSASVTVNVTVGPPTVRLVSPLDGAAFTPGVTIPLAAAASSSTGITRVDFLADGALIGSDSAAPFAASWASSVAGAHELTAIALAGDGQPATSAAITIYLLDNPGTPPLAEITAPADGASITAPTPVLGMVRSTALRDWSLDYRRMGGECEDDWLQVATGTNEIHGDALATFDPTLLLNGHYELRLTVRDRFGGTVATSANVSVEGNMKVGHFTIAFNDLTVPVAGIPITVTRTYDSRDTCPGDFGTSWRLDLDMLRLEKNHAMGAGWETIVTEGTATTPSTYQLYDAAPHVLTVRMPDGEVLRFTPKLIVDRPYNRLASLLDADGDDVAQAWLPFQYTQPLKLVYRARSDTKGATLRAISYRAVDPWLGGATTVVGTAPLYVSEPYAGPISLATFENSAEDAPLITDANGWELTTRDGRIFSFDENGRLLAMRDRTGNTLTIVRDAAARVEKVVHSAGKEIVFHRDGDGRIERITDPRGHETHYGYDALGRLTAFFDRGGDPAGPATNSFTYQGATHLLSDFYDGRGVRAAKNYYDPDGRLQRAVDADGNETVFTHNLAGRTETIRDRGGHSTTHHYDERGNVTRTESPDGTVSTFNYHVYSDGRKSDLKTSESIDGLFTEANGTLERRVVTTHYAYEDDDPATPPANDGLLRKLVDPLGHVTRFAYDASGNLLAVRDALGRDTTNSYYPNSNLLETVTDAAGNVTSYTYDARGQIDKETRTVTFLDLAGATSVQTLVTDYDYNPNGYLVRLQDARGHVTMHENDTNGNRLKEITTRTVNGAVVSVVTEHQYDANDRRVRTWDAEHPRSGPPSSETVYDENGKPVLVYDALRRETGMLYNARGLLERTNFANGTNEQTLYDAEGRREYSYNRHGKATRFKYDAVGRLRETWFLGGAGDAPVQLSATQYDAAGRVWKATDARGKTTTHVYDDAGRRRYTVDALSQASESQYDEAGNLRFFIDAKGHVTEHVYDLLNRRIRTIFPAAVIWNGTAYQVTATEASTTYDELGRRTSETDQSGKTKRFIYNELGWLTAVVDAAAHVTSYGYDELGNRLSQTDANTHTTSYGYDNLGRTLTRKLPGMQIESMQYDGAGNLRFRTDFNGHTTEYQYDALNRLRFRLPQGAAAENVEWRYTASGQRERMIDASGETVYGYDARDRLTSKATPQGTLAYGYDAAGNLLNLETSTPEGAAMVYSYDGANRLDTVTDRNNQVTDYGYDEVGNLQSVALPNGAVAGYGYNAVNRVTLLTIQSAQGVLASYQYGLCATGHRRAAFEDSGRTSVYEYDTLWRLKKETISGDLAGKNGQVSYDHDPVGNRLNRSSNVAGLTAQTFTYDANDRVNGDTYDANGNTKMAQASQPVGNPGLPAATITGTDNYDAQDHLTTRAGANGTVQIIYNGDGHKVQETVTQGGITTVTSYLVDELNPTGYAQVIEEKTNGVLTRVYTYGHDLISQDAFFGTDWHLSYYGYDAHGSVRFLTNEFAQITDTYDYDAFGNLLAAGGATPNRYLYAGEQFDTALGLYYLRARMLNPLSGRFWNMDNYQGDASDPQSLHKYLYAHGDPVNGSDPGGNMTMTELMTSAGEITKRTSWALPTIPGITTVQTFLFRAVLGTALGLTVNGYVEYYLPQTIHELEKLATELQQQGAPYAEVEAMALKGANLHVDITKNNVLRPFFWAQLGIAINGGHAVLSGAHMNKYVTEVEELVAARCKQLGIPIQVHVNRFKTIGRFLTLKADPAGDVRVLGEALKASKRGDLIIGATKINELRLRLRGYAEITVGESSEY